jgi:hypothetical protein
MQTTRKIRFIDHAATTTETFRRGKEYDVDPTFAANMIGSGAAVAVEPEADAEPTTDQPPATSRRKRNAVDSHDPAV